MSPGFSPVADATRRKLAEFRRTVAAKGLVAARRAAEGARRVGSQIARGDWKGAGKRVGLGLLRLVGRVALLGLAITVLFVLVTALVGRTVQSSTVRWLVGGLVVVALPLAVQGQTDRLLRRWANLRVPGTIRFLTTFDALLVVGLLFSFGREAGSAVRRHGDWVYGYRMTPGAQRGRAVIRGLAAVLERFRLPPEMRPHDLVVDAKAPVFGPPTASGAMPVASPVHSAWLHPLLADERGERALPFWETRRFGAARGHPSPEECERGHCGVDLAADFGAPVFAAYDGVVERVERDARSGGLAGRFLRLGHQNSTVVTRYLHLSSIRADLREGDHVVGGEVIGFVGRTGVVDADTHLHFALSERPAGHGEREVYLDPEPYLAAWELVRPPPALPTPMPPPAPAPSANPRGTVSARAAGSASRARR